MIPSLLPAAIVVMVAMAGVVYLLVRGFKAPPREDALPATVPISLSEPDLERLAGAVADAIRGTEPSASISASSLIDDVKSGAAKVTSNGVLDEVICFRLEGFEVRVDRAGRLVELTRA
ncbi:MAG: hypothetical protein JNL21_33805 [Myxococcales bacterium]|nr:hypothetical protein [Myxococcales bacterium]